MANTRKASTRGRNTRKPSTLRTGKRETNIVDRSQEQQKNVSTPETRRPWQGRLRARGQQQSSSRANPAIINSSVSSSTATPDSKLKSTSKIDNNPDSEDDESEEQEQVPRDTLAPAVEENNEASHENTDSVPNEGTAEDAAKAKELRSVLKETFNPQPPSVVREGNRYNLTDYPDEFNKEVKQLLTRLHRCFRHRKEPESKEFIASLMNAAIYSAKSGAMSALYFETSAEELSAEISMCRKHKLKEANEAIAKLPKISDEKESRKCRFVEEPEVNIYAPHDFEVKDRMLRKFEMFLDGKTTKDLSKAHLEFKHDGPISAEDLRTYVAMAEMMQDRINQQSPRVPLLSAASVYIRENSSRVDTPAPTQSSSNIQQPAAASSSSGSRLRLTQGPSLADSNRIQEILGAVKRKRESQAEDKEEEEGEELEMPSKRQRLNEKIDDADQSRVADCETNKAQTPVKKAETEKAEASTEPAKENTPPRPSKARGIGQSPERPAHRPRTPMQDCAAVMQTQAPQVEDSEAKPRRSARGRTPAPKTA